MSITCSASPIPVNLIRSSSLPAGIYSTSVCCIDIEGMLLLLLYALQHSYYKDDVKKVVMRIIIKTVLRDCRQRASIRENKTNTHIH